MERKAGLSREARTATFVDPRCDAETFRRAAAEWTAPFKTHWSDCVCLSFLFVNPLNDEEKALKIYEECVAGTRQTPAEAAPEGAESPETGASALPRDSQDSLRYLEGLADKIFRDHGVVRDCYLLHQYGLAEDHTLFPRPRYDDMDEVMAPGSMCFFGLMRTVACGPAAASAGGHAAVLHRSTDGKYTIFCPQSKKIRFDEDIPLYLASQNAVASFITKVRFIVPCPLPSLRSATGRAPGPDAPTEPDASPRRAQHRQPRLRRKLPEPPGAPESGFPSGLAPRERKMRRPDDAAGEESRTSSSPAGRREREHEKVGGTVASGLRLTAATRESDLGDALGITISSALGDAGLSALLSFLGPWERPGRGREAAVPPYPRSGEPRDVCSYLGVLTGARVEPVVFYEKRLRIKAGLEFSTTRLEIDRLHARVPPYGFALVGLYRPSQPDPVPAVYARKRDGLPFLLCLRESDWGVEELVIGDTTGSMEKFMDIMGGAGIAIGIAFVPRAK